MKVLHIVYNLIRGGTEGQCARTALALAERGVESRVAVFRREGFFLPRVEDKCGPVHEISICRMASFHTVLEVFRLASFIRTGRFNIVHCWDADAAIFGAMASRLARVPFITSRRDLGHIYAAWKLRLMQLADRHAAAVVANAEAIAAGLPRSTREAARASVIPNMLDVRDFDAAAKRPRSLADELPDGRLVVVVSRLDPEKGVDLAVRGFMRLFRSRKDARLVIAGDGPMLADLKGLAAAAGGSGIVFLGEVMDVPALLAKAEIGMLTPTANEGLSNSVLEYMAAGLPVVATDCGGNRELVRSGLNGLIVAAEEDAVSEAVAFLLDHSKEARTMGAAGRRVVEQMHQPGTVAGAYLGLYERVLSRKNTEGA